MSKIKTIQEVLNKNKGNALKVLIPLLHRLIGAMFNEIDKGEDIDTEWYRDSIAIMLTFLAYEAYDNPKKGFKKYSKIVDNEYENFEKDLAEA